MLHLLSFSGAIRIWQESYISAYLTGFHSSDDKSIISFVFVSYFVYS